MRVKVAQLNPVVGDVVGNLEAMIEVISEVKDTDLLVFSELFLTGYPPKDLLFSADFLSLVSMALIRIQEVSRDFPELSILFGMPFQHEGAGVGLYNVACVVKNGRFLGYQAKRLLPTYDVFDEKRYFDSGCESPLFDVVGERVGIAICEDAWSSYYRSERGYDQDPLQELVEKGATVLVVLMASPYEMGKDRLRLDVLREVARKLSVPLIFVNQVGGVDDLVFDGGSARISSFGTLECVCPFFKTGVFDLSRSHTYVEQSDMSMLYQALCLGLRDYVYKCGFQSVVLGVSGGIDSALVATLAVDALGSDAVLGIALPSPYSSEGSLQDAIDLSQRLGIEIRELPIHGVFSEMQTALGQVFQQSIEGITEENLQARLRGCLLMAVSNQENRLLLTTGNKSELAVGYCTLYGDMNGGFAPISDLSKSLVYALSKWINRSEERIPFSSIEKPPSAELRPNQTDQDTLPDYTVLDAILEKIVVEGKGVQSLVAEGFDESLVSWIFNQVFRSEYKRFQSAPGLKVTGKSFGSGRRMVLSSQCYF